MKVLDILVDILLANGARYNLLNSVIIELFSFIDHENIRELVGYVVTNHDHRLKDIDYVATFRNLRNRHEQNMEYDGKSTTNMVSAADSSEYHYFEMDSDNEERSSVEVRQTQRRRLTKRIKAQLDHREDEDDGTSMQPESHEVFI